MLTCFTAMAFAFYHEEQAAKAGADTMERLCRPEMTVLDCVRAIRGE